MTALLEIEHLTVWRGENRVLDDLGLTVPDVPVLCVLGGRGSGKSILARALCRLEEGARGVRIEGRIRVLGEDVSTAEPAALRRRIGVIVADPPMLPGSILDNVAYGPRVAGLPREVWHVRVEAALRAVGLWKTTRERLRAPAGELSLAERRLLAIARVLANEPVLLVLDDPLVRLDPRESAMVEDRLYALTSEHRLLVTCRDAALAGRLATYTVLLEHGRVVESGPTGELFTRPRQPATEAYLSRRFGA